MKSIFVHAGLLLISAAAAFSVWSRDEKAEKEKPDLVEVWSEPVDGLQSIGYETKQKKIKIEPKKDALGRWYSVRVDKEETPPPAAAPVDGGAPPPAPAAKREESTFVGVKEADKLVEKLATFKAVRSVGKVEPGRVAEYGLDKPEGTLKVKASGKEYVLTIGAQTPGGGERYAKYDKSGEVFAIEGDLVQAVGYAESRLMARDIHGFEEDDVKRVRITKGAATRDVVRVPEKKEAWADVATPTKPDETVVNFMSKLDRVRPFQYVEKPATAPRPDQLVVRAEYFNGPKSLGFFELYKLPGEKGSDYLARTEYTRWYVKVVSSVAEQVEQDLATVVK